MPGSVIVVNGASSAGKSTLCRAAQPRLPRPFLHYGLDVVFFGDVLPRDADGGLRSWSSLRPRVVEGFFGSVRAFADAGVDVLTDIVVEDREGLRLIETTLAGLDVFWVGLHAPVEELERRERDRGDRGSGDARRDLETVHSFRSYDLDLDSTRGAEANAAALVDAWRARVAGSD